MIWLTAVALLSPAATGHGADWPRWRGPNGDGISKETGWNPKALEGGAKVKWQANVGDGYSAVAIRDGKLYTMGNTNGQDVVLCLEAGTGKEVWRHTYPCAKGDYAGPRVTPTLDGNAVLTLSREGHVFSLNALTGEVLWKTNLVSDLKAKNNQWGLASSPYIVGELVLFNAGKCGIALKKATGETAWSTAPGPGAYATPVLFDVDNKKCAAIFGQKALYAVQVADGKELWSVRWETAYDVNAADPIFLGGNRVFVSSGYNRGCALLSLEQNPPKEIWQNRNMRNHFSTCVLLDGFLYGLDGNAGGEGALRCIDPATGFVKWQQAVGFGSLMAADGNLIVLNDRGTLFIVVADSAAYKQLSKADVAPVGKKSGVWWTMPVLCNGMIYCRGSAGPLICVDVSK